eukprot:gene12872-15118_t
MSYNNYNNNDNDFPTDHIDESDAIYRLDREELIDNIKTLRDAYYDVKGRYKDMKKAAGERTKEIDFQRRLLSEREDLLLQLQWDPNQDNSYLLQVGASDPVHANELKMKALLNQMRIMEKGIFDRDDKIASLEKSVEVLTLGQINGADKINSGINNKSPMMANVTNKIQDYPLSYGAPQENNNNTVNVLTPSTNKATTQSPSFWKSPSSYISYMVGWSNPEDDDDVPAAADENEDDSNLAKKDRAETLVAKNNPYWEKERKVKNPAFIKAAMRAFGLFYMRSWLFFAIYVACQFVGPQLLRHMVKFVMLSKQIHDGTVQAPDSYNPHAGYYYALGMFGAAMVGSFAFYQSNLMAMRTGNYMRSVIVSDLYKKMLKLNNQSRAKTSPGEVVNLMSNDAQRLVDVFNFLNTAVFAPVQLLIAIILLYTTIGWPTFPGVFIIVVIIPLNGKITTRLNQTRRAMLKFTDRRLKMINEVLGSVKIVKLYAWETTFTNRVNDIRSQEIKTLKTFMNFLEADKLFAALAYLSILRAPLAFLPMVVALLVQLNISMKRVTDFLMLDEIQPVAEPSNPSTPTGVYAKDASFTWTDDGKGFSLQDITINCSGPSLTMIVGSVGSGKSSICQALLGEMTLTQGTLESRGKVAYVAQQAWLVNASM